MALCLQPTSVPQCSQSAAAAQAAEGKEEEQEEDGGEEERGGRGEQVSNMKKAVGRVGGDSEVSE